MEPRAPYPGLRPFHKNEVDLFFGREGDVDEILDRLKANRFIAVLGASGSGKSSLVRTGLLEALELGLLRQAGSSWRFADLRPGSRPLLNLARALLASRGHGEVDAEEAESLETMLRDGPRSIIEWSSAAFELGADPKRRTNLLLLVDQFEELFSYDTYAKQDQAQAFVNLLIESANEAGVPIYVVLTMRSEYLGACALLDGLAEAINRGQYLTPRLSREQCRLAIEEPARVCGVEIESALTNRLLNDLVAFAPWHEADSHPAEAQAPGSRAGIAQLDRLARRADQLPLMQHVLNRLWTLSIERGETPPKLRVKDYEAGGGLRGMLSGHADEVLDKLIEARGESIRAVAEKVFRALVSGASVAIAIRRRTSFGKLVKLADDRRDDVRAIVDAYRAPGCNFLVTEREELDDDVLVDISHESFIRQWRQLRQWVEAEAAVAAWWRRLREDATDWQRLARNPARSTDAAARLLRDIELTQALDLRAAYRPSAAWTEQYGGGYETVAAYLEASQKAQKARDDAERAEEASKRGRRRLLIGTGGALGVVLVTTLVTSWFWHRESQELDTLKINTAHAAIDSTLSTAMAIQGTGDWATSGTIVTAVTEPLLVLDDRQQIKLHGLKRELEGTLDTVLQRQRAGLRAGESIQTFGPSRAGYETRQSPRGSRDSRSDAEPLMHAYYGKGGGRTALVNVLDNRIDIYATDANDAWSAPRSIALRDLAGSTSSRIKISSVALYGSDASNLAIVSGDVMFLGTVEEFAADEVWPVRIKRPDGAADARGSRELENTYADASFRTLAACHGTLPHFLAFDVDDAVWMLTVSEDNVQARRLFKGRPSTTYSVDLERNLYAVVLDEKRVHVGACDSDAEPVELPVKMDKGIRDIEFTSPGVLGIAGNTGQFRFIELDRQGRSIGPDETMNLPPGTDLLRFAYGRMLWLVPGERFDSRQARASPREPRNSAGRSSLHSRDGGLIELWDTTTRRVEGTVVSPDARLLERLGASHWLAFMSSDGKMTFQKPVWRSPLPLPELAAAMVAVGGGVTPQDVEKSTQAAFDLLRSSGIPLRAAVRPGTRSSLECPNVLERLVDEIERNQGDIRSEGVLELAREAKANCEKAPSADRDEQALLVWLDDEITSNSDATEIPFDAIRHRAAVLAARGNPAGLRLLAMCFSHDRARSASLGLQQIAAQVGRQLPYALLDMARQATSERALRDVMELRRAPSDGRDDEIIALSLLWRKAHAEALVRLAAAQRYYLEAGDHDSATAVAGPRREAAAKLTDEELVALWRRMHLPAPTPKPGPTSAPAPQPEAAPAEPLALHVALEKVASRLSDPIAKSEILIEAANAAPTDELKIELLMKATGAATSERLKRLQDTPKLAEAARQFVSLGARGEASVVIAEHLALLDARANVQDDAVASITEALRIAIDAKAAEAPQSRVRLADMNWGFVNFRWTQGIDDRRRALLSAALELQEALAANGIDKMSLRLAQARTRFWLGVFSGQGGEDGRQVRAKHFADAVALFDSLPREAFTFEVRLQLAEALRWKASFLPYATKDDYYAVAEARDRSRATYEDLLQEIDSRARDDYSRAAIRDDYVRTAAVAGLSAVLRARASVGTEIAREELAAGNIDGARRAALDVMRNVYKQSALFEPGRYADIRTDNPSAKNLCCLRPESQAEDVWMVGLLAGAMALERGNLPAPSQCERLATHPYDPVRRVRGIRPTEKAIEACEREAANPVEPARTAYLLGRAYSFSDDFREEALDRFAEAASANYAQAFFSLSFEFSRRSRTCSVVPALLDRYRHLVLRDHLAVALQSLRDHIQPSDVPVLSRLRILAEREPETTRTLPKLGDPLPLTFLKELCD